MPGGVGGDRSGTLIAPIPIPGSTLRCLIAPSSNPMHKASIHPSVRLLLWLSLLLAVQGLTGYWLLAAVFLSPLVGRAAVRRAGQLVWRTRWVLLSVFLFFSWGVAGDAAWDSRFAPTFDGLILAATQLGRLLLVLVLLAAFLESMSLADLLAATHDLLKPFRRAGLDPDRGVIRLMLTLRCVEELPRPRDWKALLETPVQTETESLEIDVHSFSCLDSVLSLLVVAALGTLWMFVR